jgi:hypothetical protein
MLPPKQWRNPRSGFRLQAAAVLWHRPLFRGALRAALGVPCRLPELGPFAALRLGIYGAMYTGIDSSWTTLSSGLVRSCCPLTDLLCAVGGPYVDVCHHKLGFASICLVSVATRPRDYVSRSCALAEYWYRRVYLSCVSGVRCSPQGYMCKVSGSGFSHELDQSIFSFSA